jgi:alpha-beta hydrolase superfamily lysophospholipase
MKAFEIGAKKTIVFYLHGLRGHAFAQKAALQHMVKNVGVSMVSLELPGHGEDSFVEHCMVPRFMRIVASIKHEVGLRSTEADQVILMGYSFGGALMALAARELDQDLDFQPKVSGFIGISTAFDVGHNVPRWQLGLANAIAPVSRFLFAKIRRLSRFLTIREMNVELISPDLSVQEAIYQDELVYKGRIPLNTSAQVYKAGLAAKAVMHKLEMPSLLLHSRDDAIAVAPRRDQFGPRVQLRLFKKLRHNCLDGLAREAVVSRKAITQFIADKL